MVTILMEHKVADFAKWRSVYDADSERRASAGIKEIALHTKADDPNHVYMVWSAENSDMLEPMLADENLKQAMQEAGVISKPSFMVFNNH